MKIGEGVKLAKPTPGVPHQPFERSSNNSSLLVMTLRNTAKALIGFVEKTETPTQSSSLGNALKIGVAALAGVLVFAKDAEASVPTSPVVEPPVVEPQIEETRVEEEPTKAEPTKAEPTKAEPEPVKAKPRLTVSPFSKELVRKPEGSETVDEAIRRAASYAKEDPKDLRAMIHLESRGDPRARNGQYVGLGQIGKEAWADVQAQGGVRLPALTNDDSDPRYDPYWNSLATAKLMGLNRERIRKALGARPITLGLLYAAHNVGAGTVKKLLAEQDSSKWDATTKKYVGNQAKELIKGGIGNYLANAEQSMEKHYASANVDVGNAQVAAADSLGVMSSVRPERIKVSSQTTAKVANNQVKVPAHIPRTQEATTVVAASNGSSGTAQSVSTPPETHEEPFRLRNGKLATV